MKLSELKMIDLARQLTLALADEVTHHGSENCSEASLKILAIAVSRLGLLEEHQEIWKLNSRTDGENVQAEKYTERRAELT